MMEMWTIICKILALFDFLNLLSIFRFGNIRFYRYGGACVDDVGVCGGWCVCFVRNVIDIVLILYL